MFKKKASIVLLLDFSSSGGTRTFAKELIGFLHACQKDFIVYVPKAAQNDVDFQRFSAEKKLVLQYYSQRKNNLWQQRQPFSFFMELRTLLSLWLKYRPSMLILSHGSPPHWLTTFCFPWSCIHFLHTCVRPLSFPERYFTPLLLKFGNVHKKIVTVSHYAVEQIKKHWRGDATYIHNPTPFPQALSCEPNGQKEEKLIVTLGHVVAYKNPYVWLSVAQRVLQKHPDARFIWYGDGPLLENMRQLSNGIQGVEFYGVKENTRSCYKQASIYFHPSTLESHGIAVLEAMSHGLPCVTSNAGGLPESVQDGRNGYTLNVDDGKGMADALCTLLESAELRQCMGVESQCIVREKFMPHTWKEKLQQLLEEVCPKVEKC